MFMRAENLHGSLEGICASCNKPQQMAFSDVWHLNTLYKHGACPGCNYEHWIPIRRA